MHRIWTLPICTCIYVPLRVSLFRTSKSFKARCFTILGFIRMETPFFPLSKPTGKRLQIAEVSRHTDGILYFGFSHVSVTKPKSISSSIIRFTILSKFCIRPVAFHSIIFISPDHWVLVSSMCSLIVVKFSPISKKLSISGFKLPCKVAISIMVGIFSNGSLGRISHIRERVFVKITQNKSSWLSSCRFKMNVLRFH